MKRKIVLVEDDEVIRENYLEILAEEGFEVTAFSNRADAMAHFIPAFAQAVTTPDLAILDISLGDDREGGYLICSELRQLSAKLPIIFLTSHDGDIDKISGMRLGADDYLTKDTSIDYLIVRIETLLRRVDSLTAGETLKTELPVHEIVHGNLRIDRDSCTAYWKDEAVNITLTQFWMLQELATVPGQVKSLSKLMSVANIVVEPNTVAAHVKSIRNRFRKLDSEFDKIKTEYGVGYRWKE